MLVARHSAQPMLAARRRLLLRCDGTRRFCTDPHSVLGVPRDADQAEIRRQYLALAKSAHPDAGGDTEAFRRIQTAYEKLSSRTASHDVAPDRPPSAGAQAYRRGQAGMAQVGMAMQLASTGRRAEALEILLSVGSVLGALPGTGQVCTSSHDLVVPFSCLLLSTRVVSATSRRRRQHCLFSRLARRSLSLRSSVSNTQSWPRSGKCCSSTTWWMPRHARRGKGSAAGLGDPLRPWRLSGLRSAARTSQGSLEMCGGIFKVHLLVFKNRISSELSENRSGSCIARVADCRAARTHAARGTRRGGTGRLVQNAVSLYRPRPPSTVPERSDRVQSAVPETSDRVTVGTLDPSA